jgi:hypothetical protein
MGIPVKVILNIIDVTANVLTAIAGVFKKRGKKS